MSMVSSIESQNAERASGAPISARGLVCEFITKKGSTVRAMGPVDVEVHDREFVCVVGPSGCGKSTLLRVIAGLAAPSGGEMRVRLSGESAIRPIAMVFQDYGIYPWKDVERNVGFGLELAGVAMRERRERVARWIHALHLDGFERAYPRELSGGMRQRVAIARALAVEPEILLMDEPFAAVEVLRLWQAEARTVVMVTHSLEEALVLSDRVVVISRRPGRIPEDVRVPFTRPRGEDVRSSEQFLGLRDRLWALLRAEVGEVQEPSAVAPRGVT